MDVSIIDAIIKTTQQLKSVGVANPALDARLLIQHVMNFTPEDMTLHRMAPISNDQQALLNDVVKQRMVGRPIAKIIGHKEFWGRVFKTTNDTLDPRPDSECLIDYIVAFYAERNPPQSILDIGTGTGCLLLSLLHEFPDAKGVGVDISDAALAVARDNAIMHTMDQRACFVHGDLFDAVTGQFDMIISNPPYIPTKDIDDLSVDVKMYDPHMALDGGEDGLSVYRRLIACAGNYLTSNGLLIMEIGLGQEQNVMQYMADNHFNKRKTIHDLTNRIRGVCGIKNG